LPHEDLRRFGYTLVNLERFEANAAFESMMEFEIARAEQYFTAVEELEPLLDLDGQRALRAMATTYRLLLSKIKQQPSAVFAKRIRLSRWEKLRIAARALFQTTRRSASAGLEWKRTHVSP
jgi:phytoene synthase